MNHSKKVCKKFREEKRPVQVWCVCTCMCTCIHTHSTLSALLYLAFLSTVLRTQNCDCQLFSHQQGRSLGKAEQGQGFRTTNKRWIRASKSILWIVRFCTFILSVLLDTFSHSPSGYPSYILQHEDVLLSTHTTMFFKPCKGLCQKMHQGSHRPNSRNRIL